MEFKSLEDLEKYIKNNPKEAIKICEGQEMDHYCPICKKDTKFLALKDGNLKCLDGDHLLKTE